jgi:hypothetical protein
MRILEQNSVHIDNSIVIGSLLLRYTFASAPLRVLYIKWDLHRLWYGVATELERRKSEGRAKVVFWGMKMELEKLQNERKG